VLVVISSSVIRCCAFTSGFQLLIEAFWWLFGLIIENLLSFSFKQ